VPLLLPAALLASDGGRDVVVVDLAIFVAVTLMLSSGDPEARLTIHGLILARQINTLTTLAVLVATALRKRAGALGELGGDRGILGDPVGEGIFAVLDDTRSC
jgi:hypothetical protein